MYQLRRFRTGVLLLLVCMVPLTTTAPLEAAPAQNDFTLRIIFDGLIPFWASDNTSNPGKILFFMGPQDPSGLPLARKMPQHVTHLLIRTSGQEEITASGRPLSAIHGFRHGDTVLADDFMSTTLAGEDITLSGAVTGQLDVRGLSGVINLPKALQGLPGTSDDKRVRSCLTGDRVDCPSPNPQLTARFVLRSGKLSPGEFFSNGAEFVLADNQARSTPQPVPRTIVAELNVSGPLTLSSHSLLDNSNKGTMTIQGHLGRIVEVHVVSHPNCADEIECRQQFPDNDFLFNYTLLNKPTFNQGEELPIPKKPALLRTTIPLVDTPVFNVQCSPVNLTQ